MQIQQQRALFKLIIKQNLIIGVILYHNLEEKMNLNSQFIFSHINIIDNSLKSTLQSPIIAIFLELYQLNITTFH